MTVHIMVHVNPGGYIFHVWAIRNIHLVEICRWSVEYKYLVLKPDKEMETASFIPLPQKLLRLNKY